jgi:hypothetical protein
MNRNFNFIAGTAVLVGMGSLAGCGSIDESEPKPRLEPTGAAGTAYGDTLPGTRKRLDFQLRNSDAGLAKVKTLENIVPTISGTGLSLIDRCPASLDEGESCSLEVYYQPVATGTLAGTLRVTSNAATVSLALTGVAEQPLNPAAGVLAFTATPDGNFGTVRVGRSVTRTYTLRNIGNAADALTIANPSGSGWSASDDCPDTLDVNSTCSITVVFAPTEDGTSVPSPLSITDAYNTNYGGLTVSLTGTGD